MNSGIGSGVNSARTGLELTAIKRFKWSVEGFKLMCTNPVILRSQNIRIPVEEDNKLSEIAWKVNITLANNNRDLELNYFSFSTRKAGVKIDRKFVMRISFSGKEQDVYNSGLQDRPGKCILGQVNNLPLINGALVLVISLEVYRDVGLTVSSDAKWNEIHVRSKQKDLLEMLNTGNLSDIKIVSGDGKEFFAHKLILKAGSEVFDAMFNHDMIESSSGVLNLDDMSGKAVKFLLHFLYSSELLPISVDEDDEDGKDNATIEEVIYLASKYRFTELIKYLDENMVLFYNGRNILQLAKLCKLYDLECGKIFVFHTGFSGPFKDFVFSRV